jgi:hypothetical protein
MSLIKTKKRVADYGDRHSSSPPASAMRNRRRNILLAWIVAGRFGHPVGALSWRNLIDRFRPHRLCLAAMANPHRRPRSMLGLI